MSLYKTEKIGVLKQYKSDTPKLCKACKKAGLLEVISGGNLTKCTISKTWSCD